LFPVRVWIVPGEVVEDVRRKEVGEFLQKALGEEVELGLFISNGVCHRGDAFLDVVDLCGEKIGGKGEGFDWVTKETEARGELDRDGRC
jgi:hypothetical protein